MGLYEVRARTTRARRYSYVVNKPMSLSDPSGFNENPPNWLGNYDGGDTSNVEYGNGIELVDLQEVDVNGTRPSTKSDGQKPKQPGKSSCPSGLAIGQT